MSTQATGYYTAPVTPVPVQTTTAPALPQPVPVNVNVNNTAPPGIASLGIDQFMPSVANAASYAPYVEGAIAGLKTLKAGRAGTGLSKMASMSKKGRSYAKAVSDARGGVWQNVAGTVKTSALVAGVISAATNGYKMYKGELTMAQGGSNIAGDLVTGVAGGLGAGLATAAGATVLTTLGVAGLPLTIAGFGLGIAGYLGADTLLRRLPAFEKGKQAVHDMLAKLG